MKTKTLADFEICISVPLTTYNCNKSSIITSGLFRLSQNLALQNNADRVHRTKAPLTMTLASAKNQSSRHIL